MKKREVLHTRISAEHKKMLIEVSAHENRSMASMIEVWIKKAYEDLIKERKKI